MIFQGPSRTPVPTDEDEILKLNFQCHYTAKRRDLKSPSNPYDGDLLSPWAKMAVGKSNLVEHLGWWPLHAFGSTMRSVAERYKKQSLARKQGSVDK